MANYFKNNLKYIRELRGLSKNKLSELSGVNQSTIGRWENGEISPSIDNVIDLMNALKIPLDEIGSFLGKDLRLSENSLEIPRLSEEKETELLKEVLTRKGLLDENDEMTEEDYNRLMDFVEANKQFILKDKK